MKRLALLVPFLLLFTSLAQLNAITLMYVSPDQILRPLEVLGILLVLLIPPAYWITQDWILAALLLSVLVIGFSFSPGFFSTFILFSTLGGVLWLAWASLRRVQLRSYHILGLLAIAGLFFTGFALWRMSVQLSRIHWSAYQAEVKNAGNSSLLSLASTSDRPDIYYIILDGYARSDILQDLYHFDNHDFIDYLHEKGFFVPTSNHSNYPATTLSVASTLNMDYIQSFTPSLNKNSERWLMAPMIKYSRVRALMEERGYQTVSLSSDWTTTENDTTDVYLHPYPVMLNDFEGYLLSTTPLKIFEPLLGKFTSLPTATSFRETILYDFDKLADLPKIPGPKFVFVHIISPHPPFAFDKSGNPIEIPYPFTYNTADESAKSFKSKYIGQVQFVNDKMEKALDAILANSKTPPIILIQADHGSGLLTDLNSPANTCIQERYSPFAAYYLPGMDKSTLPPDLSSVNLFRLVLNNYFHTDLPLLEDRQYFNQDRLNYYLFEDVTGRLRDKCTLSNE
jgi:hypothetical protein